MVPATSTKHAQQHVHCLYSVCACLFFNCVPAFEPQSCACACSGMFSRSSRSTCGCRSRNMQTRQGLLQLLMAATISHLCPLMRLVAGPMKVWKLPVKGSLPSTFIHAAHIDMQRTVTYSTQWLPSVWWNRLWSTLLCCASRYMHSQNQIWKGNQLRRHNCM
eukprot:scaffold67858_cov18-Tisochrysis_lutea.AAC.2